MCLIDAECATASGSLRGVERRLFFLLVLPCCGPYLCVPTSAFPLHLDV